MRTGKELSNEGASRCTSQIGAHAAKARNALSMRWPTTGTPVRSAKSKTASQKSEAWAREAAGRKQQVGGVCGSGGQMRGLTSSAVGLAGIASEEREWKRRARRDV